MSEYKTFFGRFRALSEKCDALFGFKSALKQKVRALFRFNLNGTRSNRAPHPWAHVRRENNVARLKHMLLMAGLGVVSLAAVAVAVVFAGIVAIVAVVGVALMTLTALITRKPIKVSIRRAPPKKADGVLEARKNGSTWEVY